jgi:hypothetical protein
MKLLCCDIESYYDKEYSLKKLNPAEYALDRRFEAIMLAASIDDGPQIIVDAPDIPAFLAQLDPANTITVCFNAMFDSVVLSYRYRFMPAITACSMQMAKTMYGHKMQRQSLHYVAEFLKLGVKGTEIENMVGVHYAEVRADPARWERFSAYARTDNDLNRKIFARCMADGFPQSELRVMDSVLRCTTQPRFLVDTQLLVEHLDSIEKDKKKLLADCGITDPGGLRSADKFVKLLEARGVEIQFKPSHTDPTKKIPALAKTDQFLTDLLVHEDEEVQALASARLDFRSTIEQSRAQRILNMANLNWPDWMGNG